MMQRDSMGKASVDTTSLHEFPALFVTPSRRMADDVLAAARGEGVSIELRGFALLESAQPTPALHFDLTPWISYLAGLAGGITPKIVDGAVGEIGAGAMRRFARMVRNAVDRATHKPYTDASVSVADHRTIYNLPGADLDAAAEAILADVGLGPTKHALDHARFWVYGRWIGGQEYRSYERELGPFVEPEDALPRQETFVMIAALRDLFGAEVAYVSRGRDIGVRLPRGSAAALIEEAIRTARTHLPNSTVGLDDSRKLIVISDGLT